MGLLGAWNRGFLEAVTQLRVGVSLRLSNSKALGPGTPSAGGSGPVRGQVRFSPSWQRWPPEHLPSARSLLTLEA